MAAAEAQEVGWGGIRWWLEPRLFAPDDHGRT